MAGLDKETMVARLVLLFKALKAQTVESEDSIEYMATEMGDIIDSYVKNGVVIGVCPPNGGNLVEGKVI